MILDPQEKIPLITTFHAKESIFNHFVELQGNVNTNQNLVIYPEFSGVLSGVYVKEGQKVLLFFGFVRKYKGLDLLLEALPYCNENTVVLIAGECYGEFTEYQNTIDQHQLSSRILNHVRYIPDAEVAEVFSVTDVCVLPYRSATQSGIASIAKYYQVPMVVTPVGELPNELIDGETGVVCESSAPQKIAEGINRCLLSLHTFSEALKAEKDEHNWKNFSSELIAFVNALDASI